MSPALAALEARLLLPLRRAAEDATALLAVVPDPNRAEGWNENGSFARAPDHVTGAAAFLPTTPHSGSLADGGRLPIIPEPRIPPSPAAVAQAANLLSSSNLSTKAGFTAGLPRPQPLMPERDQAADQSRRHEAPAGVQATDHVTGARAPGTPETSSAPAGKPAALAQTVRAGVSAELGAGLTMPKAVPTTTIRPAVAEGTERRADGGPLAPPSAAAIDYTLPIIRLRVGVGAAAPLSTGPIVPKPLAPVRVDVPASVGGALAMPSPAHMSAPHRTPSGSTESTQASSREPMRFAGLIPVRAALTVDPVQVLSACNSPEPVGAAETTSFAAQRISAQPPGVTSRVLRAVQPSLSHAANLSEATRDARSGARHAPSVNNTFNVNVALSAGLGSAEREALQDALADLLCDAARRQGLDV